MTKSNNESKPQSKKKTYSKITGRRVKSKLNKEKKSRNKLKIEEEKKTRKSNPVAYYREQEWKKRGKVRRQKTKIAKASRRAQRRAKKGLKKVA